MNDFLNDDAYDWESDESSGLPFKRPNESTNIRLHLNLIEFQRFNFVRYVANRWQVVAGRAAKRVRRLYGCQNNCHALASSSFCISGSFARVSKS